MRDADLLKQEILSKVLQYYSTVHKPIQEQTFIPEKSRISYDKAMNNALWIGIYPAMTQDMLKYMADSIFSFVRNRVSQ